MNGEPLPRRGRLLGVDFGTVRVGLAVSDLRQQLASPLKTLERSDVEQEKRALKKIVAEEEIVGVVVGLPIHGHGGESAMSTAARQYGQKLADMTGLPVCFFDERYSSQHADALLMETDMKASRRKAKRDMLAAQILLSAYMESSREGEGAEELEG